MQFLILVFVYLFLHLSISVSLPLPLSAPLSLSLSVMQVCNESLCVYMCAYFWRQLMFSFLFTLSSLFLFIPRKLLVTKLIDQ